MNSVKENALDFIKLELKKVQLIVSEIERGREVINFKIKSVNGDSYQLFFKSIDFGTEIEL
jgi:hypothetical protein